MDNYIVGTIDAAQIALYAFWIFFAGLVIYLVRESMREGYPTISEVDGKPIGRDLLFPMPAPKTFLRRDGSTITVPEPADEYELKAEPTYAYSGAPVSPTGDPLVDGVGPAAWTKRPDVPDRNHLGEPRLRPLSYDNHFYLDDRDADPRGMKVRTYDGEIAGTVSDVWVDRAEYLIRYLQVETPAGTRLLPMAMSIVSGQDNEVRVRSVTADQMTRVPAIKDPTQITLLEEDMVQAYYSGGTLYSNPKRTEPLL
jgi:photosynthetic reaction center H subunit